ncbi:hypothetical protein LTR20_006688 [Exophiala xenobiotica]|nr:hypothetical protein LTS13_006665 [Exophiala xenobiotica]KAK5394870.1 hypothetical protein LTR79_007486 [Exophiala xenobiotica]KAK5413130.1 hypothetical protein LTR90_007252 [Exophiala xenobiotica]KAK5461764.1 hypothetical protein LTR20_006688 [Exophiala xenobiotica]KAK5482448.1 hypothetical protein LTR26_006782 [Exophiala xenobiotica]
MALPKLSQVDAIHKCEGELLTATCSKDGVVVAFSCYAAFLRTTTRERECSTPLRILERQVQNVRLEFHAIPRLTVASEQGGGS